MTEEAERARADKAEALLAAVIKALDPEMRSDSDSVVYAVTQTVRFAMGCRRHIAALEARAAQAEAELAGAFGDDSYRNAWAAIIAAQRYGEPILDTVRRLCHNADSCWQHRLKHASERTAAMAKELARWSEEL